MATLASNWLTRFQLLLKYGFEDLLQTCHKYSLCSPIQVLLHLSVLTKWGHDQVLLTFKWM